MNRLQKTVLITTLLVFLTGVLAFMYWQDPARFWGIFGIQRPSEFMKNYESGQYVPEGFPRQYLIDEGRIIEIIFGQKNWSASSGLTNIEVTYLIDLEIGDFFVKARAILEGQGWDDVSSASHNEEMPPYQIRLRGQSGQNFVTFDFYETEDKLTQAKVFYETWR